MSSSTAPKVGDTITTYDQLKQLPDGTVLTFNRLDGASRFVLHDGDIVKLFNKDGDLRNRASPERLSLGGVSYVVMSIPDPDDSDIESILEDIPDPEPEPEWRVGQTVDTYEDLRRLPEGTVIMLAGVGAHRRRTIETHDGVLGAWDDEGFNWLPKLSDTFRTGLAAEYTITRLPAPEPEPEPDADELTAFKRQVVEVATRLAKEHGLCNEVDKALEELGLPIRNRTHTIWTVSVSVECAACGTKDNKTSASANSCETAREGVLRILRYRGWRIGRKSYDNSCPACAGPIPGCDDCGTPTPDPYGRSDWTERAARFCDQCFRKRQAARWRERFPDQPMPKRLAGEGEP